MNTNTYKNLQQDLIGADSGFLSAIDIDKLKKSEEYVIDTVESINSMLSQKIEDLQISSIKNLISGASFDIKVKSDDVYIFIRFKYKDKAYKGCLKTTTNIENTICSLVDYAISGIYWVDQLNNKLSEVKVTNGTILNVQYVWGIGNDISISYWDYSNVNIRLNSKSILTLIEHGIEELNNIDIHELSWKDNIVEFLSLYNQSILSKITNSHIDDKNIPKLLTENMLSTDDVSAIISKNVEMYNGSQKLKSVSVVYGLGTFIAMLIWNIDYKNRSVSVDIMSDKVIDVENMRFIEDHNLYSRVEHKLLEDTGAVSLQ